MTPLARGLLMGLLLVALGIKVGLLFTSQSMADGDEAVEGLMGIHILHGQGHPIYPYGIRYGAGAGVEAHLGAVSFALFGISPVALKAVGLVFWCANLLLLGAIGRRIGGTPVALAALVLFAFSPSAAQWSLKVAGGHQVAVTICLTMLLLVEHHVHPAAIVPLAPMAAFAHPVALPFAGLIAVYLLVRRPQRLAAAGALAASTLAAVVLLYPRLPQSQETWNPVVKAFHPSAIGHAVGVSLTTFFSPNLNAALPPSGALLSVSLVWMAAFAVSLIRCREKRLLLYAASTLAVALLVDPALFSARHLIVLQPLACLVMGLAIGTSGRRAWGVLVVLILLGGAVQINELRSPFIYGAGREADGVKRSDVHAILERLQHEDIRFVYNAEPMLQWILMFETREHVIARGLDPADRVPEYARRVDEARHRGQRVALVIRTPEAGLEVYPRPPLGFIEANFPPQ